MAVDAVAMELPGHHGRMSWAYLLEDADARVHLIDCGADSERNRTQLRSVLVARGRSIGDIASVTATHVHFDHVGMAAWLRRESRALVQVHRLDAKTMRERTTYGGPEAESTVERWGVPQDRRREVLAAAHRLVAAGTTVQVDVALEDGDRLDVPGWDLAILATPGHSPGHICVVDAASSSAFVGDHVLPHQRSGAGLGGPTAENPVDAYVASIDRLAGLELRHLLPGHGDVIHEPGPRLAAIRAHHLSRRRQVLLAAASADTVWEMALQVGWSRGWDSLGGVLLFSALHQVESYLTASFEDVNEPGEECA
jgi:glyoxylase-like metal-dependent hydrolase (beta-lactamase superfamily II)